MDIQNFGAPQWLALINSFLIWPFEFGCTTFAKGSLLGKESYRSPWVRAWMIN